MIRPALAQQSLQRHGLVRPLDLGMVGGTALADEADVDAQGEEPEMQAGRKWRGRRVIVKDRAVIQRDAPWQAGGHKSASEHQLVGFQRGIGRIHTWIALDLEATHHINNGDQTDVAYSRYVHATLSIEFSLVMRGAFRLDCRGGQVTVLLIAARQFLGTQQRCNAGATGQGVSGPAGINS